MQGFRRTRRAPPETVAAVDLGSNSFHMVVARRNGSGLIVIDRIKEMVRLAEGLSSDGCLHGEARARALDCLQRFGQRLRDMPRGSVRAVGTNTLRQLPEDGFLSEAEEALGHPIEVVAGVEEARLVYVGVAHSLADDGAARLVVDIGGGSTELIIGEDKRARRLESLYMGCVSFSQRYFPDDRYNRSAWRRAEEAALMELEPVTPDYREGHWQTAIGTSGTIRAVQAVAQAEGWCDDDLSRNALHRVRDAILESRTRGKLKLAGLAADRRPVFAGGVAVLCAVFEALGIQRMRISDGALREGLLYDLLGRIEDADSRDASVRNLAERYHVERQQAERVKQTALALFAEAAEVWDLGDEHAQLLAWAAELHEIGLDIAHSQYHKHSEYIARNADMAGFSRQNQAALATLIRCHRRKLQRSLFETLPERDRPALLRLSVLLRLAVVLNRGRNADGPHQPRLRIDDAHIHLQLSPSWLDAHPLTMADLQEEARQLEGGGFALAVERAG